MLACLLILAFIIPAGCAADADSGSITFYVADAWPVNLKALMVKTIDIETYYVQPKPTAKGALNSITKPVAEDTAGAGARTPSQTKPSPTPPPRPTSPPKSPAPANPTPTPAAKTTPPPASPPPVTASKEVTAATPPAESTGKWLSLSKNAPGVNLSEVKNNGLLISSVSAPPGDYSQLRFRISEVAATFGDKTASAEPPAEPILINVSFKVEKGKDTAITLNLDGESSLTSRESERPVFKPVFKVLIAKPPLLPQIAPKPADPSASKSAAKAPTPPKPSPTPTPKPSATAARS